MLSKPDVPPPKSSPDAIAEKRIGEDGGDDAAIDEEKKVDTSTSERITDVRSNSDGNDSATADQVLLAAGIIGGADPAAQSAVASLNEKGTADKPSVGELHTDEGPGSATKDVEQVATRSVDNLCTDEGPSSATEDEMPPSQHLAKTDEGPSSATEDGHLSPMPVNEDPALEKYYHMLKVVSSSVHTRIFQSTICCYLLFAHPLLHSVFTGIAHGCG